MSFRISGEINRDALTLLLRHNYIPAPYSIYNDIYSCPREPVCGSILANAKRSPCRTGPRVNTPKRDGVSSYGGSEEQAATEPGKLIKQSLAGQMGGRAAGRFCPAGSDPQPIVALIAATVPRPVKTFTVGFREDAYNEAEHAVL